MCCRHRGLPVPRPQPIEHSEPTRADPLRTAVLVQEANERAGLSRGQTRPVDSNSHGPWYDQDPTGGHEVYEDEKPSVVGRAAIGVAMAAGLSVVVFAVLRMTASSGRGRPQAASRLVRTVFPVSTVRAAGGNPGPPTFRTVSHPRLPPIYRPDGGRHRHRSRHRRRRRRSARPRDPTGSDRAAATGAGFSTSSTGRPTVVRVGPAGARAGARTTTPARTGAADDFSRAGTSTPGGAVISAPPASHMAAGTAPSSPSSSSSPSFAPSEVAVPPPSPPASKPAAVGGSDRARGKSYNPDSTLPLNLD